MRCQYLKRVSSGLLCLNAGGSIIVHFHRISVENRQNKGGTLAELTGAQKDMYEHFSDVAVLYNNLRATDLEPVIFIKNMMDGNGNIAAADIGCGAGRYSLQFLQHLGLHHLAWY